MGADYAISRAFARKARSHVRPADEEYDGERVLAGVTLACSLSLCFWVALALALHSSLVSG